MKILYWACTELTVASWLMYFADSDFPSPPAFKQTNDHHENFNSEECGSPRSEFSLTFEWKHILAAGNAAGMSTRDPSASNFDYKARNGASNVSDADSDISNLGVLPQVVRRKPRRNWSMELPRVARILNRSGSGDLKDMWVDDKKTRTGAIYGKVQKTFRGVIGSQNDIHVQFF